MKIFVDSADIEDIKALNSIGIVDGVTTNPSLVSKLRRNYKELLKDICNEVSGPVSAEVRSHSCEEIVREGRELAEISNNIVIKIPFTIDGLKACRRLINDGCKVNMTLCFSANQALLAAKAGATFISPFLGRLDDISIHGINLITDICTIFKNYAEISSQVIVASIRSPLHVLEAAKIGAHIITAPPEILNLLIIHPLTQKGIEIFDLAWDASKST